MAADCGSMPYEQFFLCFAVPLILHRLLKGVSFSYILASWAMNTLLVLVAVVYSGHLENLWSVSHAFFFLYAIYEKEKFLRIAFQSAKRAEDAERKKHEIKLEVRKRGKVGYRRTFFFLSLQVIQVTNVFLFVPYALCCHAEF
jgi:hypothetical protein